MTSAKELEAEVDDIFGSAFEERAGRTIPTSADVALKNGAVQVEACFLYADLAGSAAIAAACPWDTTAKIIRAYLKCATRLIRSYGGEIRSFDGDRVMGVFMGEHMASDATDCAREIFWATEDILDAKARAKFESVAENGVRIRQACGIDLGKVRAVRAGIRNNNDLVWIGKSPSLAAKLSDVREHPYCTFITKAVHDALRASSRTPEGHAIWEARGFSFAGSQQSIYRSKWKKRP